MLHTYRWELDTLPLEDDFDPFDFDRYLDDSPIIETPAHPLGARVKPMASEAWISPSGAFHYVTLCGHANAARVIWPHTDDYYPGDALERAGWLHLSGGIAMLHGAPTQAQLDTLFDTLLAYRAAQYRYTDSLEYTLHELTARAA
jgi:hypothetical protein